MSKNRLKYLGHILRHRPALRIISVSIIHLLSVPSRHHFAVVPQEHTGQKLPYRESQYRLSCHSNNNVPSPGDSLHPFFQHFTLPDLKNWTHPSMPYWYNTTRQMHKLLPLAEEREYWKQIAAPWAERTESVCCWYVVLHGGLHVAREKKSWNTINDMWWKMNEYGMIELKWHLMAIDCAQTTHKTMIASLKLQVALTDSKVERMRKAVKGQLEGQFCKQKQILKFWQSVTCFANNSQCNISCIAFSHTRLLHHLVFFPWHVPKKGLLAWQCFVIPRDHLCHRPWIQCHACAPKWCAVLAPWQKEGNPRILGALIFLWNPQTVKDTRETERKHLRGATVHHQVAAANYSVSQPPTWISALDSAKFGLWFLSWFLAS